MPVSFPDSSTSSKKKNTTTTHTTLHRPLTPQQQRDPVVAALDQKNDNPYSSVALSWDRQYAVTACKDTLQIIRISPAGIKVIKILPIAHHFHSNHVNDNRSQSSAAEQTNKSKPLPPPRLSALTAFGQTKGPATQSATSMFNVVITDVAWSAPQQQQQQQQQVSELNSPHEKRSTLRDETTTVSSSSTITLIAAAASNGVIVVWNADTLLEGTVTVPEVVLSQHTRAVNRLDWHPQRAGQLLSASQDGKVILWERTTSAATSSSLPSQQANTETRFNRFFGGMGTSVSNQRPASAISWQCRLTFEPKSEAVRDIRWSPFFEDVFALVTGSGSLIAYNMTLPRRALVKLTAHSGDATTCDWHPKHACMIATGGAADRCVKVWNLEDQLGMDMDEAYLYVNQNTVTSRADSIATESSTENESSMRRLSSRGNPTNILHMLSVSASVTRVRWRPLASDPLALGDEDRHESMIAVATAPIKGASSGGAGLLMLWSWNRPFMPLSVVEGHKEGAVTDFHWLDTPMATRQVLVSKQGDNKALAAKKTRGTETQTSSFRTSSRIPGSRTHEVDAILFENSDFDGDSEMGIWQHVLSVGRDGRCLIQSFARGDRPISRVPPSCFAMACLSPYQAGYGSLQIFSVCQEVPSGPRNEFLLTGLRRDITTASAPGIFQEDLMDENDAGDTDGFFPPHFVNDRQLPSKNPELHFNVIDQGYLDDNMEPLSDGHGVTVAPELVHMSRFASRYEMYLSPKYKSRVDLCIHNADVAQSLRYEQLAEMWRMVAGMLGSSGTDGLPTSGAEAAGNVMQFVLIPTIRSVLEERADAGDVQTCVTLCEVLEVVTAQETVKIPGLEIEIVREWYFAYIDLLQGMCLFSRATFLIKNCSDPFIAALNKKSTTVHESCPQCGKALLASDGADSSGQISTSRRLCRSCRRRIGFCFLCHEPVKGMYVWCPACGHGGHLGCALEWFGGPNGKPVREVCPTGCGHKCNMMQQLTAFPRTESLEDLHVTSDG